MLTHITRMAFELKHKHGTVTPAADDILALSVKLYTIHGRGVPFHHSYQIVVEGQIGGAHHVDLLVYFVQ